MSIFGSKQDPPVAVPPMPTPRPIDSLDQAFKTLAAQKDSIDANELAVRMASVILEFAVKTNASDILFDPHGDAMHVRFRIDGLLKQQLSYARKDFPITARLRVMANFAPTATTNFVPEDGRFQITLSNGRAIQFRISAFPSIHGDRVVLRVLDLGQTAPELASLGFAPDVLKIFQSLIYSPSGVLFVSGRTGSGKTTTLCSALQAITRPEINIMTLEDPVEYELPNVIHAQVNPKFGFSFADGLRAILRQSPNVIMVGEVRDPETAEIALQAALTGHMIFSTVHATTAAGVVHRLIGMGIEPYMITSALTGCLAQRLVRKVCSPCAQPVQLTQGVLDLWMRNLDAQHAELVKTIVLRSERKYLQGRGCAACGNTGYKGRVGVFELLVINSALRDLIYKKASENELRQAVIATGMKTLLMDGVTKVLSGVTTPDEIHQAIAE